MDNRIHELQQRLKKRRSQQQQKQQQQQPAHPAAPTNSEEQKNFGSRPGQTRKPGQNIAAVEPYIQYAPKEAAKDDLYSKPGFLKQDPKYQTLPPNTKFIPSGDEGSKPGGVGMGGQEVNNNNNSSKSGGVGVGGVRPVEYKIPSLISSHFDAHRGRAGSAASRTVADSQGRPGVGGAAGSAMPRPATQPTAIPTTATTTQGSGSNSNAQQQQPVNSVAKGPRPFVNTFGKSGLPKWPPEPIKDDDEQPQPPAPQQPPPPPQQQQQQPQQQQQHQPQINIFDEERQAGSGQSSPASSEGSGPLVKQGSGVFAHPQAASSQNQPGVSASQAGQGPPVEPRGTHFGRQGPKPPPRMPHGTAPARPGSSASQSAGRPTAADSQAGGRDEVDSSSLTVNDSVNLGAPQATSTPNSSSSSNQTPQGGDGKTGTTIHLNQRPAPTYRSEFALFFLM